MTELMGVVAYSPATAAAAATPTEVEREMETEAPPPLAAVDVPIPPIDVDPAEAEAAVRAEFAAYASGSGGVPSEAGFRLRAAGALTSSLDAAASPEVVCAAPFASNSRAIVDELPKHWPGPSGPGPAVEMHLDEIHLEMASREYAEIEIIEQVARRRDVAVGVIDVKSYFIETPEHVAEKVRLCLRHAPAEKLSFAPDCGLSQTARWAARKKLANMVAGVQIVRDELGV